MNQWLWAATIMLALLVPLLGVALFAGRIDALVAVEAAGSILALALVMLAEGFHRSSYTVLGLVAAIATFAGSLVFVRYFERELEHEQ
jgi:multicomponent Na+:H+ antiporter subunit F